MESPHDGDTRIVTLPLGARVAPVPRSVHSELCALQARLRPAKPGPEQCILGAHRFSVKKTALPGGQSYETLQSQQRIVGGGGGVGLPTAGDNFAQEGGGACWSEIG